MKSKILAIMITFFSVVLVSCNRNIAPVTIPTPPPKTESVIPSMKKVNDGIDNTIVNNNLIGSKLKDQKDEFKRQHLDIQETLKIAEELLVSLKDNPNVPANKITVVVEGLHKIEARNMFLENRNNELEALNKEQDWILKSTKANASDTLSKLHTKENETKVLREQNESLGKSLQAKNDEAESLKKELADTNTKLATANVYKNWIWGLVGGFVLWTIIKNILMFYFPTTRFRL